MAATAKTVLPEESELTVQELDVSWPVLQTAAVYIGKACEWYNNVSYDFYDLVGERQRRYDIYMLLIVS